MKTELENKIFEKYDKIFRNRTKPMSQTCMCWGLACGDGWYHILDYLCKNLQEVEKKYDVQVIADQIKQKFGGLRFYYHVEHGERWSYKPKFIKRYIFNILNKIQKFKYFTVDTSDEWYLDGKKTTRERKGNWSTNNQINAYNCVKDLIDYHIGVAENMCDITCESCGITGASQNESGWISTLCEKCKTNKSDVDEYQSEEL
jgi:hypothetical protein